MEAVLEEQHSYCRSAPKSEKKEREKAERRRRRRNDAQTYSVFTKRDDFSSTHCMKTTQKVSFLRAKQDRLLFNSF